MEFVGSITAATPALTQTVTALNPSKHHTITLYTRLVSLVNSPNCILYVSIANLYIISKVYTSQEISTTYTKVTSSLVYPYAGPQTVQIMFACSPPAGSTAKPTAALLIDDIVYSEV
jgi:hypothetical protein